MRPILGAAVFLLVLAVFWPAVDGDFVDYDDALNFVQNPNYRGLGSQQLRWMFTTFHGGHYQPLSWVTLGFDYVWGQALFGPSARLDPRPYHVTNIVLHAGSTVLVYFLALKLLLLAGGSVRRGWEQEGAALLAALLFGLHPLRVESVAWATERRDVLSSFLLLATVLLYLGAAREGIGAGARWVRLTAAFCTFALSLSSRLIGVTLPLILLVFDRWLLGRIGGEHGWFGRATRAVWLEKLPFAVLAVPAAVLAPLAARSLGASHSLGIHGVIERLAVACYGLVFYTWKSLWPGTLSPLYEIRYPFEWTRPKYVLSALAVVTAALLLVHYRRRWPKMTAAAACYALVVLPVLGLFQVGSQEVASRYSYLPGVVLGLVASSACLHVASRVRSRSSVRVGLIALATAVVLLFAGQTRRQLAVWRNSESLWAHAVRAQPESSLVQSFYGAMLVRKGAHRDGEQHLRRAIELDPRNGWAHRNLWALLSGQGEQEKLAEAYRETIRLIRSVIERERQRHTVLIVTRVSSPVLQEAHTNLGIWLLRRGELDEAVEQFRRALEQNPEYASALGALGVALLQKGDAGAALPELRKATKVAPDNVPIRYNLAVALVRLGAFDEARAELRQVLRLDPRYTEAAQLLQSLD